jgi:hypothetical protein
MEESGKVYYWRSGVEFSGLSPKPDPLALNKVLRRNFHEYLLHADKTDAAPFCFRKGG